MTQIIEFPNCTFSIGKSDFPIFAAMNLLYINWDINPEIVNILGIPIKYYGLLFLAGLVLSLNILKRIYKKEGQEIKKVAEQLPEPDRKSLEAEVAKQLEALGPFDVEVNVPKPEDKKQERYQRSPLYQRLVDKVKGGK